MLHLFNIFHEEMELSKSHIVFSNAVIVIGMQSNHYFEYDCFFILTESVSSLAYWFFNENRLF